MNVIPIVLLTGFLGSGKTTLLNALLRLPAFRETAVIVNEAGEVGVDDALIEAGSEDILLLEGGCVCCRMRGSLNETLQRLLRRRMIGGAPIRRVIIETSGLADPAPILHTLIADPLFGRHFQLAGVTTVVDAANVARTLENHAECRTQIALADRILITKTDLVTTHEKQWIEEQITSLNPRAELHVIAMERTDGALVWLDPREDDLPERYDQRSTHRNRSDIITVAAKFPGRLERDDVDRWLDHIDELFGDRLLRLKGILWLEGMPEPVVLHGVQGLVYSPGTLADPARVAGENRMVLIARAGETDVLDDMLTSLKLSAKLSA